MKRKENKVGSKDTIMYIITYYLCKIKDLQAGTNRNTVIQGIIVTLNYKISNPCSYMNQKVMLLITENSFLWFIVDFLYRYIDDKDLG